MWTLSPAEEQQLARAIRSQIHTDDGSSGAADAPVAKLARTDPPPSPAPLCPTATVAPSTANTSWDAAVRDLKSEVAELDDLCGLVVRKVMTIAEKVGALQLWHAEQKAREPEAVPVSFVKGLADALGRSKSHVEQWLTIFRMDPATKDVIAQHPRINRDFTGVLAVAREADPDKAAELVLAYEHGGRPEFNALLQPEAIREKTGPGLRKARASLNTEPHSVGGVAPPTPPPAEAPTQLGELGKSEASADVGQGAQRSSPGSQTPAGEQHGETRPEQPPADQTTQASRSVEPVATVRFRRDGTATTIKGLGQARVVAETELDFVVEVVPDASRAQKPAAVTPAPPPTTTSVRRRSRTRTIAPTQTPTTVEPPKLEAPPEGATNVVQFTCDQAGLSEAIRIAELVKPAAVTPNGESGYLFVVRGGACRVEGRTGDTAVCATACVTNVEAEGQFVVRAEHIAALKLTRAQATGSISLGAYSSGDTHHVQYAASNGSIACRTTLAARHITALDPMFADWTNPRRYPSAVLREALKMAKPFVVGGQRTKDPAEARHNENAAPGHKLVNIYDGRDDGTLHATNGLERFYFSCDVFKGKPVHVPAKHLSFLLSFLGRCGSEVELRDGEEMTFAVSTNGEHSIGWTRCPVPAVEYKALPRSWDRVTVRVPHGEALQRLKHLREQAEKGRDTIKVRYSSEARALHLGTADGKTATTASLPVELADGSESIDYDYSVSAGYLIDLIEGAKAANVELGMIPMEEHSAAQGGAVFRTTDVFWLNPNGDVVGGANMIPDPANGPVFKCTVTRLVPSQVQPACRNPDRSAHEEP
jgi:hypothetical protein